ARSASSATAATEGKRKQTEGSCDQSNRSGRKSAEGKRSQTQESLGGANGGLDGDGPTGRAHGGADGDPGPAGTPHRAATRRRAGRPGDRSSAAIRAAAAAGPANGGAGTEPAAAPVDAGEPRSWVRRGGGRGGPRRPVPSPSGCACRPKQGPGT